MTVIYQDIKVPITAAHPKAYDGQPIDRYNYMIRAYYENFWGKPEDSKRPIVLHFHGSGGTGPANPEGAVFKELIARGYNFFSCQYFSAGKSSHSMYSSLYYNVNSPRFLDLFIKTSWWVKESVDIVRAMYPDNPIILYGHSMGAAAVLAYAAGYTGFDPDPNILGILSSGATVASLGNGTWNDIWRNIRVMSGIVHFIDRTKVLMVHADDDPYGPPEYAMRLQLMLPANSPVYAMSAGIGKHEWAASNPKLLAKWIDELRYNRTITDKLGKPAVSGPTGYRSRHSFDCGC